MSIIDFTQVHESRSNPERTGSLPILYEESFLIVKDRDVKTPMFTFLLLTQLDFFRVEILNVDNDIVFTILTLHRIYFMRENNFLSFFFS